MDYTTKKITYSQVSKKKYWHCYTCGNFGHKEINCRINERNNYARYMNGANSRYGNIRRLVNINYNPFDTLMDQNIVCYK